MFDNLTQSKGLGSDLCLELGLARVRAHMFVDADEGVMSVGGANATEIGGADMVGGQSGRGPWCSISEVGGGL